MVSDEGWMSTNVLNKVVRSLVPQRWIPDLILLDRHYQTHIPITNPHNRDMFAISPG